MNLTLKDVTCTSRDAEKFYKIDSLYIRGYTVKYMSIPPEVADEVKKGEEAS